MDDARIGTTLDRYRIEALLGRGGFGSVYRARHQVLGKPVALKVLHARAAEDAGVVERFLQEAKAASAIGSGHIVEVFDAGSADGAVFLAMELLEGEDLARRIARGGPLSESQAITIGLEVLDALAAAHAAGIVHRDLKPGNVFLARDGAGRERAKLLDFGISKVVQAGRARAVTAEGEVLGTPLYMAPEQLRSAGEADARADLWSWGAMVLEMISKRTPYEASSFEELVVKRLAEPPRSVDELAPHASASLRRLLSDCLALAPADRPPSAAAIAAGLRAAPVTIARASPITREHPVVADTIPEPIAARIAPEPAIAATRVAPRPASALRHATSLVALAIPIAISSACLLATAGSLVIERAIAPRAAPPPPPPAPTPVPAGDEEAVLGFALRMIERSLGLPSTPAAAARPEVSVLTIDPPRLDGSLDARAIAALVDRARPAIGACAREGAGDDVAVQLITSPGSPTIVHPQPFYPATDAGVADCVATAIAAAATDDAPGQGVATIAMRLPRR